MKNKKVHRGALFQEHVVDDALTDAQSDAENDKVIQNRLKIITVVSKSNHNQSSGSGSGF